MNEYKWNEYTVLLVAYLAMLFGLLLGVVGDTPECSTEPYEIWFAFFAIAVFCAPAALGFAAGRHSK